MALADYKFSTSGLEGASYDEALKQCHSRSAFKLQRLCFANGGIYIKLGQHVAQLVGLCCPILHDPPHRMHASAYSVCLSRVHVVHDSHTHACCSMVLFAARLYFAVELGKSLNLLLFAVLVINMAQALSA